MAQEFYSEEIAKEILNKFHEKGWNLYAVDKGKKEDEVIKENLADRLNINTHYILLPVADDPRNPVQVFNALELLAQRLNREMPTINISNKSPPLTGITLKEGEVKIHTPEGTYASYHTFIEAIDSIVNTN